MEIWKRTNWKTMYQIVTLQNSTTMRQIWSKERSLCIGNQKKLKHWKTAVICFQF